MMTTIPLKLVPLDVPTVIHCHNDGTVRHPKSYRLKEVPRDELGKLLDEFLDNVWEEWDRGQPIT
jgi:hypothetical protein